MLKHMSYEEFITWCKIRNVEPIAQESYEGVQRIVSPPPTDVTTVSTHEFNFSQLKKLKKEALIKLCKEFNLIVDNSDTKKVLIDKLLNLNN